MNKIQKILGYTALAIAGGGAAVGGGVGLAELSARVVKNAANEIRDEVQKIVADAAGPRLVEGYRRVITGIAREAYKEKFGDMLIPPELREDFKRLDQAIEKMEKERERLRDPNVQIEELQKIFSKGENKKDPFGIESLDLGRGRGKKTRN